MYVGYVASIEEAGLSFKEKAIKHSRDRNIHPIIIKLYIHVCLIKIQVLNENQLCETNRSGRTFLRRKTRWHSSGRSFGQIVTKMV